MLLLTEEDIRQPKRVRKNNVITYIHILYVQIVGLIVRN
jgi:hypothetical protein